MTRMQALFAMPENSREVVISHAEALRVSLRLAAPSFTRIFILLLLLHISVSVWYNGFLALSYPAALLTGFAYPAGFFALFIVFLALILRRKVRAYKTYGIPIRYGFDEEALYTASRFAVDKNRWERYASWRDLGTMFLLSDGVVQHMLPKSVWTNEELDHLRRIMQDRVGKDLPPDGGASCEGESSGSFRQVCPPPSSVRDSI